MSGTVGSIGGGGSASQPDFEFEILCDTNLGVVTKFLRRYKTDSAGATTVVNTRLDGTTAYNPVGTVDVCKDACESVVVLCDNTGEFLRHYGCDGTTRDTALDGTTAYAPVGAVTVCQSTDLEAVDFCLRANTAGAGYAVGDQLKLTRWFNPSTNTQVGEVAFNMTNGGSLVTTPLTAANFDECPAGGGASETIVCAAGVSLIRRVDAITGAVTFIGTNGAAVAAPPAYTVGSCVTDTEFEVLCDNNGSFLRRYIRNLDGTITAVTTALDGTTAYNPVGTVRACDAPVTVESHIFNVAAAASWTPANIPAGKTLVGLSYSVVTGTATVTDADGTAVNLIPANFSGSWNNDYQGVLTPPQSITAAAASRVIVHMVVK